MKKIPLTQGQFALVDDEDYEYLNQWKWYAHKKVRDHTYYARRSITIDGQHQTIQMHRLLLSPPPGLVVDHKDRNGLNNCRNNLRIVTYHDNQLNSPYVDSTLNGERKGITRKGRFFQAQMWIGSKTHYLGLFKTQDEAKQAFDNYHNQLGLTGE